MSLNGKLALVTGAATGIGASLARALALEGALVVGADLAWGESEQAYGVEQLQCDVSDPSDVERCVADIEKRHGPVDILINNAALASALSPAPFETITPEDWTRVLTVNTIAPFLCSRAVAPRMRGANGAGSPISPQRRSSPACHPSCTTSPARVRSPL
jgi:p-cumic alcohol dehydrogenase